MFQPVVFPRHLRHKDPGQDGKGRRDDIFFYLKEHDQELPEGQKGKNKKGFVVMGFEQTEYLFHEKP